MAATDLGLDLSNTATSLATLVLAAEQYYSGAVTDPGALFSAFGGFGAQLSEDFQDFSKALSQPTVATVLSGLGFVSAFAGFIDDINRVSDDIFNPNTSSVTLAADAVQTISDTTLLTTTGLMAVSTAAEAGLLPEAVGLVLGTAAFPELAVIAALAAAVSVAAASEGSNQNITDALTNMVNSIQSAISDLPSDLQSAFNGLHNVISAIGSAVANGTGELPNLLSSSINNLPNDTQNAVQFFYNHVLQHAGPAASYIESIASVFGRSMTDPVVMDLSGNGIQLTSLQQSTAFFDIHDTGFAVHTGWVGPQTGILVNDPDGDQPITSVASFFGSDSTDGFTALSALDVNHAGVINASDPGWANLYVWTDTNGNGVVNSGELQSLSSLGITSINLNATPVDQNSNGNEIESIATFDYANGTSGTVAEVALQNDRADSTFSGSYTINPVVFGLPDLRGYGTVPNLAIAMSMY